MCILTRQMRKRSKQNHKTQGCCGRPHVNTWGNGGDNIGFRKRRKGMELTKCVKRKKNIFNTNGRIHPEPQKSDHN